MKLVNLFFFALGDAFFFNNHREYIKKIIKLITKAKYKDITKKKKNKLRKKLIWYNIKQKKLPKISYYTIIWCHQEILRGNFLYKWSLYSEYATK